jgi:hypothetical protein
MRINHKILSIPPYISTSWKNINSIHVEYEQGHPILVVILNSHQRIEIPELELPVIDAIFHAHAKFMEQELATKPSQKETSNPLEQVSFSFPIKIPMGGLEGIGTLFQHNPQQADSPTLPPELLHKIALFSKTMGLSNASQSEAEPHCNCMHCQVARAIHQSDEVEDGQEKIDEDEEVSEKDLQFRTWDIKQTTEKLFIVTNPLNDKEQYQVFLGEPVGCTCGTDSCEHILAVLRS